MGLAVNAGLRICNEERQNIPNAVVTPLRKAASYEPRITILRIWGDTWLTRGKYGIYLAVRGSYEALTGSTWHLLPRNISHIYCRVSYVVVTRIPSLVLSNTWHYVTVTGNFLNLSYVAHTRRLYAKVWPRHKGVKWDLEGQCFLKMCGGLIKKKVELWFLCCIMSFRCINKQPGIQTL